MLQTFFQGFFVSLSLIVAIGAQNTFVLKQGLKKQHIFWICFICAVSDSILITAGVFGFSKLVLTYADVIQWVKYIGAGFLVVYGAQHFYQACRSKNVLEESDLDENNLLKSLSICLALTWLNPHVYLDTVILIGAISTGIEETIVYFALGAILASWIFFFLLGYGARLLQPIFKDYRAWKILDFMIAIVMWMIAYSLI
ncbi:LysE/ArgO family amino acid transporter [Acinetobacter equi]|uniref:Amino acid transporter n=1 Tax=Acinetobacter equi TaxID=1324350 RepID=A0A0N9VYH6_9GAMM|nr:LysE/ArgO family amino acid transporter [Acinetobacter equi]ALH96520.1 amino acid transporter [Acinetobacter equi]